MTLDYVYWKGSTELEKKQNQAMRSMFTVLRARARASITTGRKGTRFVTSTSEADGEQQERNRFLHFFLVVCIYV